MGFLEWILLILAAIILPPIIQAIFARTEHAPWSPEADPRRTMVGRLADDREAETLRNRTNADVERPSAPTVGEPEDVSSLHRKDTML